jgi:phage-related protein
MATQQDKDSSLKVNREFFSLEPSSIISLFEVDLTEIGFDTASQFVVNIKNFQISLPGAETGVFNYRVIRLHNNLKLGRNIIYWKGNAYLPAPLSTEGFEIASRGVCLAYLEELLTSEI